MRRFALLYWIPTTLVLLAIMAPLVLGAGTLYMRDVFSSHYELKVAQARLAQAGELPLIDPYRAGGQPLLGNPNALPLYPTNLLYLWGSPLWAMNAHFWLHLLLAPFAGFWLGRAFGLGRPAAWAVGVCYGTSGFFLSQFNLYNLVAGAALAPAFVAACLEAASQPRRFSWAAVAGLWALLLLGGDPMFAGLCLLLAGLALLLRDRGPRLVRVAKPLALALAVGTLLAAPMLVELLRILPLSFRGYWQFSIQAALSQSFDPRSAVEWLLPFAFGRPDFTFWGMSFYGGNPPLFYSVFPGVLALGLVLSVGLPRSRAAWFGLLACGLGLFFALGAYNPAVRLLYHLPGASVLRYPVKFWLAIALGAALLCGIAFDRIRDSRRNLGIALTLLCLLYLGAWLLLRQAPAGLLDSLQALEPHRLAGPVLVRELTHWRTASMLAFGTSLALGASLWLSGRRPELGPALLLLVHLVSQAMLLQPLYDWDEVAPYRTPPEILAAVPEEARVVHGGYSDLFGAVAAKPGQPSLLSQFPDPRFLWLTRTHFAQLYPSSGVQWGRRYELNHSPEGLDSFFVVSLSRAMHQLDDEQRLRILEASAVDVLLLDRPLSEAASERTTLLAQRPGIPLDLYVYRLDRSVPGVALVGGVRRAPQMNTAIETLTDPRFDPRTAVVLPGEGPSREGRNGEARIDREETERLTVATRSADDGVLLVQRAYLGIYRATVDGNPAPLQVANLHRLAVEVPAGEHEVHIWIDRRPTWAAFGLALLGLVGLVSLAAGGRSLARMTD